MMNVRISRRRFLKMVGAIGAVGLVGSYPVFIERYLIQVNYYVLPVPNLPGEFRGFRIVHLSDLHYGLLVPLAVIRWVVAKANSLEKDIIVCTGDYVHERNAVSQINGVWPELAKLKAPSGVYSVLGNHDHWADTDRSLYWLEKSGQNVRNRIVAVERNGKRIWLAGAGDYWEDATDIDVLLRRVPGEECRIVLAHNPDTADTIFQQRLDLMISGHTHGGQVKIPFIGTPVLPVKNKAYSSGYKKSPRGTPVFISRGIGWAVYPLRFNCPPEIAILDLVPAVRV